MIKKYFAVFGLVATVVILGAANPHQATAQAVFTVGASANKSVYAPGEALQIGGVTSYTQSGVTRPVTDANVSVSLMNSGQTTLLREGIAVDTNGVWTLSTTIPSSLSIGTYAINVNASSPVYGSATQTVSGAQVISAASGGSATSGTPASASSTAVKTGISIPNPLGDCNNASCVISRIIRAILGVVAVVATFMFIWGGVLMLTSGGNERQVRQAKDTLTWAAIGIIIIIVSWSIIRFVLETFLRAS